MTYPEVQCYACQEQYDSESSEMEQVNYGAAGLLWICGECAEEPSADFGDEAHANRISRRRWLVGASNWSPPEYMA